MLVDEIVADGDKMGFHFVVIAALSAGRVVQARHLEKGAVFFSQDIFLGNCAWHMQGEVAEYLVRASATTSLIHHHRAMALMIAAAWSRERKPETALPEQLVPQARLLARTKKLTSDQWAYILAMMAVIADEKLTDLVIELSGIQSSREEALQRGPDKGGGLAAAGLRRHQQVTALHRQRHGAGLHVGGRGVAGVGDGLHQLGRQAQGGELGAGHGHRLVGIGR